jgi:hypothetical protein
MVPLSASRVGGHTVTGRTRSVLAMENNVHYTTLHITTGVTDTCVHVVVYIHYIVRNWSAVAEPGAVRALGR